MDQRSLNAQRATEPGFVLYRPVHIESHPLSKPKSLDPMLVVMEDRGEWRISASGVNRQLHGHKLNAVLLR